MHPREEEPVTLAELIHHWSGAYEINQVHGRYQAVRRDDGASVTRDTAEQLLAEIREDYRLRPVPRTRIADTETR